mmetsp:Transcript_23924/g.52310  ORF Transcript_23924/g.52310 Transcript_23924/m.52310 type:complete len:200 (-) Transcript_23924:1190-1789(-)
MAARGLDARRLLAEPERQGCAAHRRRIRRTQRGAAGRCQGRPRQHRAQPQLPAKARGDADADGPVDASAQAHHAAAARRDLTPLRAHAPRQPHPPRHRLVQRPVLSAGERSGGFLGGREHPHVAAPRGVRQRQQVQGAFFLRRGAHAIRAGRLALAALGPRVDRQRAAHRRAAAHEGLLRGCVQGAIRLSARAALPVAD